MKRLIAFGILILSVSLSSSAATKEKVLLKIDGNPVTLDEFRRIYERNNSNIQDPENKKTAEEYLQLYINFKLKVHEAMQLGLDTVSGFITELAGYRADLAAPYLSDNSYNNQILEETYRRMTREVNAAHLLISLSEDPAPEDTLAAFRKISDIRQEILQGMDFNEAVVKYSQDPTAGANRGELGWFTVFQMIYPFENAAYSTPPGEVSQPFRTRFGYHMIRVNEIRNSRGEIHVAHIMKIYPQNATGDQTEKARMAIDSIYALVQNGAVFEELARQLSDDRQSAEKGGEMPWFSRSRMIPAFADPAFALEKDGDISKPVNSGVGYHIIKRLGSKPVPEFSEVKSELEARIKRDPERSGQSRKVFLNKLKEEYHLLKNQPAIDEILSLSTSWFQSEPPGIHGQPGEDKVMFSLGDSTWSSRAWTDYLRKHAPSGNVDYRSYIPELFNRWVDETVIAYEDSRLERKHPDFRSLMEEYHDGILLFTISEDKIWQKASADTAGLAQFYETNKHKYQWPERYKGMIIQCNDPRIREEVEKNLEADIPVAEIQDLLHLSPEAIVITEGTWAKNEHPVIDYYLWGGPRPQDWDDKTGFIRGKLIEPGPKLLEEAKGYHIADYQQYLEENWIRDLRKKYPVTVNKKLLKTLKND